MILKAETREQLYGKTDDSFLFKLTKTFIAKLDNYPYAKYTRRSDEEILR